MSISERIVRDPLGGGNQSGLRDQNARLVLSYLRRHRSLSSAEIARRSGLSAQTISNILRTLDAAELIRKGKTKKGKVGKPSTPIELNPTGVYSLGLNIGRRSAELALVDFTGEVIGTRSTAYPYPDITGIFAFVKQNMTELCAIAPGSQERLAGIGVSRPSEIWNWLEIVDAPYDAMQAWKDFDLAAEISAFTNCETVVQNDATSACVAEHLLGRGAQFSDFAYLFVGAFLGGGLVLSDKVIWGRTGNAFAIGILPMPDNNDNTTELLELASLHVLEAALARDGVEPLDLRDTPEDWSAYATQVDAWISTTGKALAHGAASIASVVDVQAILIDGAMPADVKNRLTAETEKHFEKYKLGGIQRPLIAEAEVGRSARSIGAALLPIHAKFFLA